MSGAILVTSSAGVVRSRVSLGLGCSRLSSTVGCPRLFAQASSRARVARSVARRVMSSVSAHGGDFGLAAERPPAAGTACRGGPVPRPVPPSGVPGPEPVPPAGVPGPLPPRATRPWPRRGPPRRPAPVGSRCPRTSRPHSRPATRCPAPPRAGPVPVTPRPGAAVLCARPPAAHSSVHRAGPDLDALRDERRHDGHDQVR